MHRKNICYFVVPGLSYRYRTGGLLVIKDVAKIFADALGYKTEFITTHEKHPDALSAIPPPADANDSDGACSALFIVTWGPLVEKHIKIIRRSQPNAHILYYAQSFGWGIHVPLHIPIICVSRYVMAQWALHTQENYIAHIPPPLSPHFTLKNEMRDIDILVHTRKQNDYCLKKLVPALKMENYKLHIVTDWIPQPEFAALLNRTKLFLYITAPHKAGFRRRLPGEGFGLPALEALACGVLVGSNLLGGVTDFLTPGENCIKLQNGNLNFDLIQIKNAVENFKINEEKIKNITAAYSYDEVAEKWRALTDSGIDTTGTSVFK